MKAPCHNMIFFSFCLISWLKTTVSGTVVWSNYLCFIKDARTYGAYKDGAYKAVNASQKSFKREMTLKSM